MSGILECRELTKRYGRKLALDAEALTLEEGRIVGLLGPNGSGKTTLMKLIVGLLRPTGGTVLVNGEKPGVITKNAVAYLPDRDFLPEWMRVRDAVQYYADFFEDFDADLARAQLAQQGVALEARAKDLSKGSREKLQLILTMSRRAELYVLDEPLGGVDPVAREAIIRTILGTAGERATVLISTHLITDVENILDEAVFIREGRVCEKVSVEALREEKNQSVTDHFKEVFQ